MVHPSLGLGYWNETAALTSFPRLENDLSVDVAVVGGGIVGVTTARVLKDAGLQVALLEGGKVGRQATGKSTAKITSQHGLIYGRLKKSFGLRAAELYADAQESGLRRISEFVTAHDLDCDFEASAACVYTTNPDQVAEIDSEARLAQEIGLPATELRDAGLPFKTAAALRFDHQAQFHPVKYLSSLAATIPGEGCHVFEDSRVLDWEPKRVCTENAKVTAGYVVMATHLPLGKTGSFFAMAHPYAEPVMAAKIPRAVDGMFLSIDKPTRSIRSHRNAAGEIWAIAVGDRFKPGHLDAEQQAFRELEQWLRSYFEAEGPAYRWVNEDYMSIDGAPFVGWSSGATGQAYLIATGFGAWGITNGTAAGFLLADLVQGNPNAWTECFSARRIKPLTGAPKFVKENLSTAKHLVAGYLGTKPHALEEVGAGEGHILKIDGRHVAAFRDEEGNLHTVSAVCTHLGCMLGWNATDRTWDCHCHGSRFDIKGEVLHGPAVTPLESKART